MAKKKAARKAPERACEACGKGYHPRKSECPHCGAKNPTYAVAKKRAAKKKTGKKKAAVAGGSLSTAVDFVSALGGIDEAQAALDTLKDIKKKL